MAHGAQHGGHGGHHGGGHMFLWALLGVLPGAPTILCIILLILLAQA